MHPTAHPARRSRRMRGMTLVELMVGLALGLLMTTALLLLFANASANGSNLARAGAHIENGRYVSDLLRDELRMAGYYGEVAMANAEWDAPDPCTLVPTGWSGAPLTLPTPVAGYDATEVLPCLTRRKAGTHAIVVRRLEPDAVDPAALPPGNARHHVQYSHCANDPPATALVFGVQPASFSLRTRDCAAANRVRAYVSRIYYVADCYRCGERGDDDPTLKRVELLGGRLVTTALADGVDDLRFEYGFDTDGNGSPDVYQPGRGAGATATWSNVMAVKVHLITRALTRSDSAALAGARRFTLGGLGTVVTPDDGHPRNVYSGVVRLMNPSGARELQ